MRRKTHTYKNTHTHTHTHTSAGAGDRRAGAEAWGKRGGLHDRRPDRGPPDRPSDRSPHPLQRARSAGCPSYRFDRPAQISIRRLSYAKDGLGFHPHSLGSGVGLTSTHARVSATHTTQAVGEEFPLLGSAARPDVSIYKMILMAEEPVLAALRPDLEAQVSCRSVRPAASHLAPASLTHCFPRDLCPVCIIAHVFSRACTARLTWLLSCLHHTHVVCRSVVPRTPHVRTMLGSLVFCRARITHVLCRACIPHVLRRARIALVLCRPCPVVPAFLTCRVVRAELAHQRVGYSSPIDGIAHALWRACLY